MRGSRFSDILARVERGIIPAHAGLTNIRPFPKILYRDHPRACGAHRAHNPGIKKDPGSSPRMRGSPACNDVAVDERGIIPAHAGLTFLENHYHFRFWDHPRACGAHLSDCSVERARMGSSPRMRGSRKLWEHLLYHDGIIPAHAGLTMGQRMMPLVKRDHPRACGAHKLSAACRILSGGSSPRMRGSPRGGRHDIHEIGIIPAHAGLTLARHIRAYQAGDHPRACGAHAVTKDAVKALRGSSPRMRGSRIMIESWLFNGGIIPAHAGLTIR